MPLLVSACQKRLAQEQQLSHVGTEFDNEPESSQGMIADLDELNGGAGASPVCHAPQPSRPGPHASPQGPPPRSLADSGYFGSKQSMCPAQGWEKEEEEGEVSHDRSRSPSLDEYSRRGVREGWWSSPSTRKFPSIERVYPIY